MTVASFVAAQRTDHGVAHAKCCRWLGVSESWFYKWHNREPTERERRRVSLDAAVRASFDDSGGNPGTYGSPRVFEDLVAAGWRVSPKTVAASMARQGLVGRSPKRKRRSLTRPDKAADPIPDLVRRDFTAEVRGGDVDGVVFHSDKGGEYHGDIFVEACDALGVTRSMGRVGSALDNAAAESFNSTLEWELLSRRTFETKDQARRAVATFIDNYNHRRRHSSCEMLPPVAYEQVLAARAAETADLEQAA